MNNLTIKIFMSKYNWDISEQAVGSLIRLDLARLGIEAVVDSIHYHALHSVTFKSQEDLNLYKTVGQIKELNDNYTRDRDEMIYVFTGSREGIDSI